MKFKTIMFTCAMLCSNPTFAQDYDEIAEKGCVCRNSVSEQMLTFKSKIEQAIKTNDMSGIMDIQNQMGPVMAEVEACFDKIAGEYPEVANDENKKGKVMEIMRNLCPPPNIGIPGMSQ